MQIQIVGVAEFALVCGCQRALLRIATAALRNAEFPLFFVRFWPPDTWQFEISYFQISIVW